MERQRGLGHTCLSPGMYDDNAGLKGWIRRIKVSWRDVLGLGSNCGCEIHGGE